MSDINPIYYSLTQGVYDPSTPEGKAANEGSNFAKNNDDVSIFGRDVQYAFNDSNGAWSRNSSFVFSKEALSVMDGSTQNGKIVKDGKITVEDDYWQNKTNELNNLSAEEKKKLNSELLTNGNVDKQKLFDFLNLNGHKDKNDKEFDVADNTTLACYLDNASKAFDSKTLKGTANDGKLSEDEIKVGFDRVIRNSNGKKDLEKLYDGYKLGDALKKFQMSNKTSSSTDSSSTAKASATCNKRSKAGGGLVASNARMLMLNDKLNT